jgi:hypothetical protein
VKKISSGQTFFLKKVFPVVFFGIAGCVLLAGVASGAAEKAPPFMLAPAVMLVVGYVVMKNLVWGLVDEVYDCGDSLLVRKAGQEDHIPLANVMNISATTLTNPPRVTLRLREPGLFGNEVTFSPVSGFRMNPFARNPIVDDLIVRVDAARRK